MVSDSATFNAYQQRRLKVTCQHIDGLLSDIEKILSVATSKLPFPKYIADILPTKRTRIERGIRRIRAELIRVLERQRIEIDPPSISAAHAVHSALVFAQIAVEELAPKHMRGYGEVSQRAAAELEVIVSELLEQITDLDECIYAEPDREIDGEQAHES